MKIKILVSCSGVDFSYMQGEIVDAKAETAKDLIDAGFAEEVKTVSKAGAKANADT